MPVVCLWQKRSHPLHNKASVLYGVLLLTQWINFDDGQDVKYIKQNSKVFISPRTSCARFQYWWDWYLRQWTLMWKVCLHILATMIMKVVKRSIASLFAKRWSMSLKTRTCLVLWWIMDLYWAFLTSIDMDYIHELLQRNSVFFIFGLWFSMCSTTWFCALRLPLLVFLNFFLVYQRNRLKMWTFTNCIKHVTQKGWVHLNLKEPIGFSLLNYSQNMRKGENPLAMLLDWHVLL